MAKLLKFRKKDGKSENQRALEAGVNRIYGCANNTYVIDFI